MSDSLLRRRLSSIAKSCAAREKMIATIVAML